MLLDVQRALILLHADIVDDEVALRGYGAHTVEDALGVGRGGNSMDDDVGLRQPFLHSGRGFGGDLLGALEGEITVDAQCEIDKVA